MFGRSSRIRTYDLSLPKRAHYQAVLYSVIGRRVGSRTPAYGFGDRRATVTLHTHKKSPLLSLGACLKLNVNKSHQNKPLPKGGHHILDIICLVFFITLIPYCVFTITHLFIIVNHYFQFL